jgi:putative transposase
LALAKIGRLKVRWSRTLPRGIEPSTVTVRKDRAGRYFVSLRIDAPIAPLLPIQQTTGIDVGLVHLVSFPDGTHVDHPRHLTRALRALARAQRKLARKRLGSKNRHKTKLRVARLHARVADARADTLHQLSTRIVRENQAIGVERLAISNMLRNHSLARGIADAGWGEFLRQIKYKADWYGRVVVEAGRFFPSSKRCSTPGCGYTLPKLDLATRHWTCPECGEAHDRDTNAARTLKALADTELARRRAVESETGLEIVSPTAGQAVAACGGLVRPCEDASKRGTTRRSRNLVRSVRTASLTA